MHYEIVESMKKTADSKKVSLSLEDGHLNVYVDGRCVVWFSESGRIYFANESVLKRVGMSRGNIA